MMAPIHVDRAVPLLLSVEEKKKPFSLGSGEVAVWLEHRVLLQRTQAGFAAPTGQLTQQTQSRIAAFWLCELQGMEVLHRHRYRRDTHICEINLYKKGNKTFCDHEELRGPHQAVMPKALHGKEPGLGCSPPSGSFLSTFQADFLPSSPLWCVSHSESPVHLFRDSDGMGTEHPVGFGPPCLPFVSSLPGG